MNYILNKNIWAAPIIYIALFITLQSCENKSEEVLPSELALNYLNDALDIMENNSVRRKEIEWISFREEIVKKVGSAQVPNDTYQAIDHAVRSLIDNHSSFLTPEEISLFEIQRSDTIIPIIEAKHIENVGYIKIPGFSGDSLRSLKFATELQKEISILDNDSIEGWIVDLRGNTGGNM
jgi:C-terminal processing protease CtpA/Prc